MTRIQDCIIHTRDGDCLFDIGEDGRCAINLVGYAIIPRELYFSFVGRPQQRDDDNLCSHCGLACEDGKPDPCLGTLPGVKGACCGHGGGGYIGFENGTIIRGKFHVAERTAP